MKTSITKKLCIILTLALILNCVAAAGINTTTASAVYDTDSIPTGYIPVRTIEDLYAINNNLSGDYILMNDIDLTEATKKGGDYDSGYGWKPIGYINQTWNTFTGTFTGNGHKIIGLNMYGESGLTYGGLFGKTSGATIKNLTLKGVSINANCNYSGGIMGEAEACNISNCNVEGTVIGRNTVGGICGFNKGIQTNKSGNYLMDSFTKSYISRCFVEGTVTGTGTKESYAGGICGNNQYCFISNCYNLAQISGKIAGGIVGYMGNFHYTGDSNAIVHGTINCCYNIGDVASGQPIVNTLSGSANNYGVICNNDYYISSCYSSSSTPKYGTMLTPAQMKIATSYTGFDFNTVWEIDSNCSYLYPQLKDCRQIGVQTLEFAPKPMKTVYDQGDKLDLTGGVLRVNYTDGAIVDIALTDKMVSGYNMNKIGQQKVIVSYAGAQISYDIEVKEIPVTSVAISGDITRLKLGNTSTLTATVEPANASYPQITWAVDPASVGSVDIKSQTDNKNKSTVTIQGKRAGSVKITATTASGKADSYDVFVYVPSLSLTLNQKTLSLIKGDAVTGSATLKAVMTPSDSTDKITWTSSDRDVAEVSAEGVVTGTGAGKATITATSETGYSDTCEVTVTRSLEDGFDIYGVVDKTYRGSALTQNIVVSDGNINLTEGTDYTVSYKDNNKPGTATVTVTGKGNYFGEVSKTYNIEAVVENSILIKADSNTVNKGETLKLTVEFDDPDTYDKSVTWSCTDVTGKATVDSDGVVTGVEAGSVTIQAETARGTKDEYSLYVMSPCSNILFNTNILTVMYHESGELTATVLPSDCTDTCRWSSSDRGIADISAEGNKVTITGVAPGTATVSYESENGKSASCTVTVMRNISDYEVTGFKNDINYVKGEITTQDISLTDGTVYLNENTDYKIKYENNDKPGTAKMIITGQGYYKGTIEKSYNVVKIPVKTVNITGSVTEIDKGQRIRLRASVTPSDASDKDITWGEKEGGTGRVIVGKNGDITGLSVGHAIVTATADGVTAEYELDVLSHCESLEFASDRIVMLKGEEKSLSALGLVVEPEDCTDSYEWISRNPDIADIKDGKIIAKGAGEAVIRVSAPNGTRAECTVISRRNISELTIEGVHEREIYRGTPISPEIVVMEGDKLLRKGTDYEVRYENNNAPGTASVTVNGKGYYTGTKKINYEIYEIPVTGLFIKGDKTELAVGEVLQLSLDIVPENASYPNIRWQIKEGKDRIELTSEGKVTAKKTGNAIVTATSGNGVSAEYPLTIASHCKTITLKESFTMEKDEACSFRDLGYAITPSDCTDDIEWTSSDSYVAVVENGRIVALEKGDTVITAEASNGKKATCNLKVTRSISDCTISGIEKYNYYTGSPVTFNITVKDNGIKLKEGTDYDVTYKNNNAPGTATLTVTGKGYYTGTKEEVFGINAIPVDKVEITGVVNEVEKGKSIQLSAVVTPDNATNKSLTWKVVSGDDGGEAFVDSDGTVTGISTGTVTVTATAEGGVAGEYLLHVVSHINKLELTITELNLQVGGKKAIADLELVISPFDYTDTIEWISMNTNIAEVINGEIIAKSVGQTEIKVISSGGIEEVCIVKVTEQQQNANPGQAGTSSDNTSQAGSQGQNNSSGKTSNSSGKTGKSSTGSKSDNASSGSKNNNNSSSNDSDDEDSDDKTSASNTKAGIISLTNKKGQKIYCKIQSCCRCKGIPDTIQQEFQFQKKQH